jgi:hypothetical protein
VTGLYSVSMLSLDWEVGMAKNSKTDDEKGPGSAPTDLPGRRLAPSKSPRMLEPFEIELLRQDLKAVLARPRVTRRR